jgi:hypothetical protein
MLQAAGLPILMLGTIALGACTSTPAPATSSSQSAPSAVVRSASPAAVQKVNANTASQDDVQRALAADGVPNPDRWAREVVEYRPYPTDDPSFAKLRQNLAKYNPAPEVVDEIVAALTL